MTKTTSNKSAKNQEGLPQKPPFPTQAEIVRVIINALATKPTNAAKKLDDYVVAGDANYQKFSEMVEGFIFDPIKSLTCESFAKFLKLEVDRFFKNYLGLVKLIALDRLTRQEAFPLLVEHYFSVRAAGFLANFQTQSNSFNPIQFVDNDKTAIEAVFNWFDENEKGWDSNCIKEDKDKYANWRKGNNLPDLQSIKLIRENLNLSPENITLLLIARAVDFFRNSVIGRNGIDSTRKHLLLGFDQYDHGEPLSLAQINANKKYPFSMQALKNCTDLFLGSTDCSDTSKEYAYERIKDLKAAFGKEDPNELMSYMINWCEARWHVKTGNLEEAIQLYKLAFKQCLYSAGKGQEMIYKDALKVAAKAKDLAFLKQLKNYGIVFGFFIAPPEKDELDLEVNNKINRGTSNIVEDWEKEQWIKEFSKSFPKRCLFKGSKPYKDDAKSGLILLTENDVVKPDLSRPNRKIKIGSWNKIYPQLVYFTFEDDTSNVRKLLAKGADVNCVSESGETPILLAIQNINPFELDAPLDHTCFDLISDKPHTPETINTRSTKKKLLPLVCAVSTGQVNVVEKLLNMQAEVDRRGETDEQTALNVCMMRIAMLSNPAKFANESNKLLTSAPKELIENIRRNSGGLSGNTLDEIKANFDDSKNSDFFQSFWESYNKVLKERTASLDIDSFRKIASLLIKQGASPNAEHNSAIKGYTPLMIAAEDDEAELFEEMIGHGGKPDKCYKHPETGQKINCFKIAIAFKSHRVVNILKSKYGDHFFRANNH